MREELNLNKELMDQVIKARIFAKYINLEIYQIKYIFKIKDKNKKISNYKLKHIAEEYLRKTIYSDYKSGAYISKEAMDIVMEEYKFKKIKDESCPNDIFYNISSDILMVNNH